MRKSFCVAVRRGNRNALVSDNRQKPFVVPRQKPFVVPNALPRCGSRKNDRNSRTNASVSKMVNPADVKYNVAGITLEGKMIWTSSIIYCEVCLLNACLDTEHAIMVALEQLFSSHG